MSAIRQVAHLEAGIVVGERTFFDVTLRPATLEDTYHATAAIPLPDDMKDGAKRATYQVRVDDAVVLCQICALDDVEDGIPEPADIARQIEPDDMEALRLAADAVKKKLRLSRRGLLCSAVPNVSSSAPASA
jgi:phage FluMu protein gp41